MKDITIKELIDLIEIGVSDPEAKIEKMFEWHFNRSIMITKWILGATVSLLISVGAVFLKPELNIKWWQFSIVLLFALSSATYGIYRLWQIRAMHKQFVSTLKIYYELKKIVPFITRYRERKRQ